VHNTDPNAHCAATFKKWTSLQLNILGGDWSCSYKNIKGKDAYQRWTRSCIGIALKRDDSSIAEVLETMQQPGSKFVTLNFCINYPQSCRGIIVSNLMSNPLINHSISRQLFASASCTSITVTPSTRRLMVTARTWVVGFRLFRTSIDQSRYEYQRRARSSSITRKARVIVQFQRLRSSAPSLSIRRSNLFHCHDNLAALPFPKLHIDCAPEHQHTRHAFSYQKSELPQSRMPSKSPS
jgi:hypothetical protein